ncbi:MAG TPA: helix-hairpin-helix domain-containing protein [Phycisphaerae bacterium]|nr:helix-hairpin-helix domain-containing protein [Phycisphaerae bacterium]HPS52473.1 helix-hairpin-helix domain-containing protein [Phycisphaerae bacterium]
MADRHVRFDIELDATQLRIIASLAVVLLTASYFSATSGYSSVPPVNPKKISLAREYINPNTDSYASLRRLPGVGDLKSKAIITYRQACENPPAFRTSEDLMKVNGISSGIFREAKPLIRVEY